MKDEVTQCKVILYVIEGTRELKIDHIYPILHVDLEN